MGQHRTRRHRGEIAPAPPAGPARPTTPAAPPTPPARPAATRPPTNPRPSHHPPRTRRRRPSHPRRQSLHRRRVSIGRPATAGLAGSRRVSFARPAAERSVGVGVRHPQRSGRRRRSRRRRPVTQHQPRCRPASERPRRGPHRPRAAPPSQHPSIETMFYIRAPHRHFRSPARTLWTPHDAAPKTPPTRRRRDSPRRLEAMSPATLTRARRAASTPP